MGSLANSSSIQCINDTCNRIPKVVFLFERYGDYEMNIIRMPTWLHDLQEKELKAKNKEGQDTSYGSGTEKR